MADDQDKAEQLDGEVLGERPDDESMPGETDYPPEQPLGVEDPVAQRGGAEADDDMIAREWRSTGEGIPDGDSSGIRLDPGESGGPYDDTTKDLIADSAVEDTSVSAEEAAVHRTDPGRRQE